MTAGRAVRPPSLIDKAMDLVKGFDPKKQTGDSYADEATQTIDSNADKVFLKQVQQWYSMRYTEAPRKASDGAPHGSHCSTYRQQLGFGSSWPR